MLDNQNSIATAATTTTTTNQTSTSATSAHSLKCAVNDILKEISGLCQSRPQLLREMLEHFGVKVYDEVKLGWQTDCCVCGHSACYVRFGQADDYPITWYCKSGNCSKGDLFNLLGFVANLMLEYDSKRSLAHYLLRLAVDAELRAIHLEPNHEYTMATFNDNRPTTFTVRPCIHPLSAREMIESFNANSAKKTKRESTSYTDDMPF